MASKSLGTLTIDLVAKVGGFVSGMDKAERASEKWAKQVQKDAAASSAALLSVGGAVQAAALAAGTAGFALLKSTSEQVNATDQWAKSLKISTQELLAWQFAAEKAGISGDNMADIFKDLSDKIGDAVLNKSGEAVDALNSLGLSADKLSKVSPDKQLLAIGESLGKISTNAGKVTILESLGNDLSKLLPLFDNNNAKLTQFIQLAKDYGVAPDPQSIDDLIKVNTLFQDMEAQVKGLKMEIAAGLAHVDLSPLNNSLSDIHDVLTDPQVLQGIADLVSQVAQLAGWLIKAAAGAGKLASASGNRMAALGNRVDMNNPDQIQARIDYLNSTNKGRGNGIYDGSQTFLGWVMGKDDSVKAVSDEIATLTGRLAELNKQPKNIQISPDVTPDTAASLLNFGLGKGETNGKPTKPKKDTEAARLESAFKTTERGYMRQIELIDTTGKKMAVVTEQQKLQFDIADGKLRGLNATQQKRLEFLAQEVDRLNAVKKANEENAKIAAFVANLQAQNSNAKSSLNIDIQGAGQGDKERQRMKERLSIQREYLDQQRELQAQYQAGDITKSLYERETSAIGSAMSDRLKIQEDYYKSMDAMQSDWMGGVSDGLANWLDTSSNYSASAASIVSSSMDSALDNVSFMLMGNKASWKDWASSVLSMIAKVALQMAAVNLIGGLVSSVGGAAAGAASAGGGTANNSFSSGSYNNLTLNAKGGVYESHDLSQYSGSVVSSPTLFAFAKGAGLMGEAGPEAIMPLTRAADGSLGVRAIGNSGGSGGTSISVSAPVTVEGGGAGETSSANTANTARQLQSMIQTVLSDRLKKEILPGGILYRGG
ncbi:phage tail tape measure protein [Pantoea graminicola]|uniref:phage tail tape measure protein n=1 Tax=Pantoea sp. ARC607 TaxID=2027922 RepID=UPI000DAA46E8|nr:phage tail tape measure protein [Pantoea sp. ARC607]PZL93188.1 phage tail tape measure protein [Pantoea sp. ARC607]